MWDPTLLGSRKYPQRVPTGAHDCYLHTGRVCLCPPASNILIWWARISQNISRVPHFWHTATINLVVACLILGTLLLMSGFAPVEDWHRFSSFEKIKKMRENSKNKILRDGLVLIHLILRKIKNMNIDILCKMASCFGNTVFLVAYDLRSKSFLYEHVSTQNFTSDFNPLWVFREFLYSQNWKENQSFSSFRFWRKKIKSENFPKNPSF
jgi:hypothetical protein